MFVYWLCPTCGKAGRYHVQRPEGHQFTPMTLEEEIELLAGPLLMLQANHDHELKIVPREDPRLLSFHWSHPNEATISERDTRN